MFLSFETMQEVDKKWTRSEIAKAIKDSPMGAIQESINAINTKMANIDGRLAVLATPARSPHPWVTPLIAVLGTAFVAFQGWMAITLVQHGNTLSNMRGALAQLGINIAASNPTNPKAQSAAATALRQAKEVPGRVPIQVIEDGGRSFVAASEDSAGAWDVALKFVAYRTSLNIDLRTVRTAQELAKTPFTPNLASNYYNFKTPPPGTYPIPYITLGGDVPIDQAAIMKVTDLPQPPTPARAYEVVLIVGGAITLDQHDHETCRNSWLPGPLRRRFD